MNRAAIIALSLLFVASFGCERRGDRESAGTAEKHDQITGTPTGTPGGESAAGAGGTTLAASDREFIQKAASGGMLEVKLGQLATEKAVDPRVKAFAQRMVSDHNRANDELQEFAQRKGITLSKELDTKHQQTLDRLSGLSGREFDRAYMEEMVRDHEEDVREFRKQAESGQNPDLKSWARNTLSTLEDHLKQARETQQSLTGGGATTRPEMGGATTRPTGEMGGMSDQPTGESTGEPGETNENQQ